MQGVLRQLGVPFFSFLGVFPLEGASPPATFATYRVRRSGLLRRLRRTAVAVFTGGARGAL